MSRQEAENLAEDIVDELIGSGLIPASKYWQFVDQITATIRRGLE